MVWSCIIKSYEARLHISKWATITLKEEFMTKADLVEKIQQTNGYSKKESAEILETVFSIMKSTLKSGEKLKIAGFGNFEIKHKADRLGRNPQTGEAITIEARRVLSFKPSNILRNAINN